MGGTKNPTSLLSPVSGKTGKRQRDHHAPLWKPQPSNPLPGQRIQQCKTNLPLLLHFEMSAFLGFKARQYWSQSTQPNPTSKKRTNPAAIKTPRETKETVQKLRFQTCLLHA